MHRDGHASLRSDGLASLVGRAATLVDTRCTVLRHVVCLFILAILYLSC